MSSILLVWWPKTNSWRVKIIILQIHVNLLSTLFTNRLREHSGRTTHPHPLPFRKTLEMGRLSEISKLLQKGQISGKMDWSGIWTRDLSPPKRGQLKTFPSVIDSGRCNLSYWVRGSLRCSRSRISSSVTLTNILAAPLNLALAAKLRILWKVDKKNPDTIITFSHNGNRTRAFWVKARYPSR